MSLVLYISMCKNLEKHKEVKVIGVYLNTPLQINSAICPSVTLWLTVWHEKYTEHMNKE